MVIASYEEEIMSSPFSLMDEASALEFPLRNNNTLLDITNYSPHSA